MNTQIQADGAGTGQADLRAALAAARDARMLVMACARPLRTAQVEVAEHLYAVLQHQKCALPIPPQTLRSGSAVAKTSWRLETGFQHLAEAYLKAARALDRCVHQRHPRHAPSEAVADALRQAQDRMAANVAAAIAREPVPEAEQAEMRQKVANGLMVRRLDALLKTGRQDLLGAAYAPLQRPGGTISQPALDALAQELVALYHAADTLLMTQRC